MWKTAATTQGKREAQSWEDDAFRITAFVLQSHTEMM